MAPHLTARYTTFEVGPGRYVRGFLTAGSSPSSVGDSAGPTVTVCFEFPKNSTGKAAAQRLFGALGSEDLVGVNLHALTSP